MHKVTIQLVIINELFIQSFSWQGGQYNYGQPQGYQQQSPYGPPPPASQYPPGYPGGFGGRPAAPPGVDPVLWEWFQVRSYVKHFLITISLEVSEVQGQILLVLILIM